MAFRFVERPGTRQSSSEPPSQTLEYVADGLGDMATVRLLALSYTAPEIYTTQGMLYRQDLQIKEQGTKLYYVTVPYGVAKRNTGEFRLSFDTTGGTVNIKVAKESKGRYAASGSAPDHKGAINVQDDNVVGCDIVIPALKLTTHFKHPQGVLTVAQIKAIARNTGKINSAAFFGFAAGEVLFMGATGNEGTDAETEIQYQFACSENLSSQVINGITVASKRGWDVLWLAFEDAVDSGAGSAKTRRPKFIYVDRVYDEFDFVSFFGFGG